MLIRHEVHFTFFVLSFFTFEFSEVCFGLTSQTHRKQRSAGCVPPETLKHGDVGFLSGPASPQGGIIESLSFSCEEGYSLFPPTRNIPCDYKKQTWSGDIPECLRTCPRRISDLVDIKCEKNGVQLDCYEPLVEGAKQLMKCKPRYNHENPFNRPSIECNAACGQVAPKGKPLIVDGVPATIGEFPWHVAIYKKAPTETVHNYICGGSIINLHIILTAAHCFSDDNSTQFNVNEFSVAAGKYFRLYNSLLDIFAQKRLVKDILIPTDYKGFLSSYSADIALVIVNKPFELTNAVQSVCLDWNNFYEKEQLISNALGMVAGWGFTTEGKLLAVELKKLTVPFIDRDVCVNNVQKNFVRFVTPDKFCTGYRNGSAVCNGDSGGGLVFYRHEDNRYYIRGLVSIGPVSQGSCDAKQYGAYTKVSHYIDYIRTAVENHSGKCKRLYKQAHNRSVISVCSNGTWDSPFIRCIPECGQLVSQDAVIIVEGKPAKKLDFSWHVGLYQENVKYLTMDFVCAGSIIGTKFVLTGARCFYYQNNGFNNSYVAAGKYYKDYDSPFDFLGQKKRIINIEYTSDWIDDTTPNEGAIAIAVIEQSFNLNNFIRPICLDFDGKFNYVPKKMAIVPGWDFKFNGQGINNEFEQLTVSYRNHDNCLPTVPPNFIFTDDSFCTALMNDTICNIESGGGLIAYSNEDKKFYIIGVINIAPAISQQCFSYITYTNVSQYLNFIEYIQNKHSVV